MGVPRGEEHRQLMRGERGQGRVLRSIRRNRPPAEATGRKAFLTEPETLAIIDQHLDGGGPPVTEHEHRAGKRILPE